MIAGMEEVAATLLLSSGSILIGVGGSNLGESWGVFLIAAGIIVSVVGAGLLIQSRRHLRELMRDRELTFAVRVNETIDIGITNHRGAAEFRVQIASAQGTGLFTVPRLLRWPDGSMRRTIPRGDNQWMPIASGTLDGNGMLAIFGPVPNPMLTPMPPEAILGLEIIAEVPSDSSLTVTKRIHVHHELGWDRLRASFE